MRVGLFDFQETALGQLRAKLVEARAVASAANPQAISFSAPTGAGKTIIMTALFEQLLFGEYDLPEQPDAVILWVSDMPELNEQTRLKIEGKSDRIRTHRLVTIDSTFDAERLSGGHVYFINTQKLGGDKLLTRPGDGRQYTIWETFAKTARAVPDRFYVVIDEAHRGMRTANETRKAQTIMQKFLLGSPEDGMVTAPMVVGVSATPRRFDQLLEASSSHTTRRVVVTADDVRGSGLLKQRVLIHHPPSATTAELSLLQEAAERWRDMESRWKAYCQAEQLQTVYPILVVQVTDAGGNAPTTTDLAACLMTIELAIGRSLREGEVAHTFNDCGDLPVNGRRVQRVEASRIEDNRNIGVVFFKQNLSTGWDCPRAEVMMSFRSAQDHTYIAQLLGRMVRTPLARPIGSDAELNDVHLLLPHFDTVAVGSVVNSLNNPEDAPPASEVGSARDLVVLNRRPGMEAVFAALRSAKTYRVNAVRSQSALRRLVALGRALTQDDVAPSAGDGSKQFIIEHLTTQIDTLRTTGALEHLLHGVLNVELQTLAVERGNEARVVRSTFTVATASQDIDTLFEKTGKALSNGLHMDFWRAHAERDSEEVKAELVVICRDAAYLQTLERAAQAEFDRLYGLHREAVRLLGEQRRQHYQRLRLANPQPQAVDWELPPSISYRRPSTARVWEKHLYLEPDGQLRAELGTWERDVTEIMVARPDVVAWLRNLDRQPWSLEVPYEAGGAYAPLFPDLVFVRQAGAGYVFDVLEPHDPTRADNAPKAVGLAKFAELHGDVFVRIGLVRKQIGPGGLESYVVLNVNNDAVRREVLRATTNAQLDALFTTATPV